MLNPAHLARTDLNLLVLFRAVMDERHVGRAAARLNLTPSAVSHSLGRLRDLLNDPLFLRTPKGVVPTARAQELSYPIEEILVRVAGVLASAAPFDPATSRRRFVVGAPDAVLASGMNLLLAHMAKKAPHIDISLIHLMPGGARGSLAEPWRSSLERLEERTIDVAMLPLRTVPASFELHRLYEEDFVVAMRKGHPFRRAPTATAFCKARHMLVSLDGSPVGFVDDLLAERGLRRRVALTVPSFMMALAHLSASDLIAVLPRRLVKANAAQFRLAAVELPFERKADLIGAVVTKAAMADAGIAWLVETLMHISHQTR